MSLSKIGPATECSEQYIMLGQTSMLIRGKKVHLDLKLQYHASAVNQGHSAMLMQFTFCFKLFIVPLKHLHGTFFTYPGVTIRGKGISHP